MNGLTRNILIILWGNSVLNVQIVRCSEEGIF
ncbi:hypothetical protein VFL11327_01905 [Vibrio fluvialis]|nr:hypothetical protein VFL11327_01905 [Vibrio fluvialis]